MNALIHLDQNGKKVMERRVHEAVMKERAAVHAPMRLIAEHRSARGKSFRGGAGQVHGIPDRGFRRSVHALYAP